jgi:hypothetical protein
MVAAAKVAPQKLGRFVSTIQGIVIFALCNVEIRYYLPKYLLH